MNQRPNYERHNTSTMQLNKTILNYADDCVKTFAYGTIKEVMYGIEKINRQKVTNSFND